MGTISFNLTTAARRYGANVTLRLTVSESAWRAHLTAVLSESENVVPVVKGNGYGFGRARLIAELAGRYRYVAVGTVHELDSLTLAALQDSSSEVIPVVLTPTLHAPQSTEMVLTVGSSRQIDALRGWKGPVLVKLLSAMHRYGGDLSLIAQAETAGLEVIGVSIHPPLPQSGPQSSDPTGHITSWLAQIPTDVEVWVSHLSAHEFAQLPRTHRYRHRIGTRLWHGDKSMFSLTAEVLETRAVAAGDRVGYRQVEVPCAGQLIMIAAGSAHGVRPLPDGRSPFHFAAERMDLIEPPHMHTSMAFVPTGRRAPQTGDFVDVQNPLTQVLVDEILSDHTA